MFNIKAISFILTLFSLFSGFAQPWSIEQCIDTALANNHTIKILENQSELAELKNKEIKANLIPKLMANGEYKYFIDLPFQLLPLSVFGGPDGQFKEAQFGVPHNINGNLTIQIPLYAVNVYGAIEKSEIAKKNVDLQVQKTKEQIYFEVSALYRNAQLLMNKKIFLDSSIHNTEKTLQNVKQLREELLATGTDIKKIELQLSILNSQREQIQSTTYQVLNGLKLYMGLELDYEFSINPRIEINLNHLYEPKTSFEIDINHFQQEIVNSEINTLQKSRYLPNVGAFGYVGTNGYGYNTSPNEFLNFYPLSFVGVQASFTLFNGTITYKQVQQKKIELINLQLQEEIIEDKTELAIYNAEENLRIAIDQIALSVSQVELAEEIYREINLQHTQGLASTFDIIQADSELRQTKLNYLTALVESIKADLELQKVTGNILD